jgi:hypothetical protein
MVDFDVLPYAIAIATVAGVIGTWIYNSRTRKDRILETRQTLAADVEKIAREKIKEEQSIARDLAVTSQALALDVKQSMKDHIQQLISTLKQDIALSAEQAESKIDKLDYRLAQIKIDLMEHILGEKDERVRMQRSIEMLQTMNYGTDAKSEPSFLVGEEETQEHKDLPGEGLYRNKTPGEKEEQTKENEKRIRDEKKDE